ncbi:MAG: class II aldolase/adducin family protein [Solirubrobacteraceae bacterium]
MLDGARESVAAAARRLASAGLVLGSAGNVSVRAGDRVAVTPTGAALAQLDAADVVVVDLDAAESPETATSELALHLGAYRRFDAGAVVHTHSPVATALACVLHELPVIHYQMLSLGGPIRVAPYETFGTPELARVTLDALEGRCAVLMSNHGTLAIGPDLETAVERSLLLEWASELYWRASAIGAPRVLDDAQISDYRAAVTRRGYGVVAGSRP